MISDMIKTKALYHYTGFDALFAILEGYRKSKLHKYLTLRASNIYGVNDTKEMEAGYNALKRFLPKFENGFPKKLKLSEVYNSKEYEEACKKDYLYERNTDTIQFGIIPYVISLSKKRDYLPMWSMYGHQGKGVCLMFDAYILQDHLADGFELDSVAYEAKMGQKILSEKVPEAYSFYIREYENNLEKLTMENKIRELATICLHVSPFFKYKDYQYEEEFRMAYNVYYGQESFSNQRPIIIKENKVKPYIEVPIPIESLKGITIGPGADYDVMKHVLGLELESCGIAFKMIRKSKIAYRNK